MGDFAGKLCDGTAAAQEQSRYEIRMSLRYDAQPTRHGCMNCRRVLHSCNMLAVQAEIKHGGQRLIPKCIENSQGASRGFRWGPLLLQHKEGAVLTVNLKDSWGVPCLQRGQPMKGADLGEATL